MLCDRKKGILLASRNTHIDDYTAGNTVIQLEQSIHYRNAISLLNKGSNLPDSSKLSFSPLIDTEAVVRVGGRLSRAKIPFCLKHPILLPENCVLTERIIIHHHEAVHHQGIHLSHSALHQAGYFIPHGRKVIQGIISKCVICRKLRGQMCTQLMSDIPIEKLEEVPTFSHVGLDVFGPFYIHDGVNTRNRKASKKVWGLVFVCLPSHAVHIETLPSLDVSSFRNALTRFSSIRGQPTIVHSDQGTNFVCARKQLQEVNIPELLDSIKNSSPTWKLNPAGASHFGGSWERKIGSIRRIFESVMMETCNRPLSRDEFQTLLAEISSIINNTPLWTTSNDPNEPTPITPAMLLTLKDPNVNIDRCTYSQADLYNYGKARYRRVQFLSQLYWERWRKEYLSLLTERRKWKKVHPCLAKGDIVLLRDKGVHRNEWPTGVVSDTRISEDGLVRSATVRLPALSGRGNQPQLFTRAIADLVLLFSPTKNPN